MKFKNFTLDKFQEEAIKSVDKNKSVMVSAPTGSGKTLIADYIIDQQLKGHKKVIYTAPIKALSNQKFKDFVEDYGEEAIGLVTGDLVINPTAQIIIMTTEVYRNMAIIKDPMLANVSYCVMDEIHYINDAERGYVWEESIIFSPEHIRFLFLSATVPNAKEFANWVEKIKKHTVDVISYDIRPVPLDIKFYDADLGITSLDKIKDMANIPHYNKVFRKKGRRAPRPAPPNPLNVIKELNGKLPCIYFVFSRAKTQEYAQKISSKMDFLNNSERTDVTKYVLEKFRGVSPDVLKLRSTQVLRQCLSKGVAFHHAGLLPDLKHVVEGLFTKGILKVLFATETFAVGINMPAKTVVFDSLRKYTGTGFRLLNTKEFFQISGRAGRRGMDKTGLSVSVIYRPTADFHKIENLTKKDTMPIISQFKMSYNTVLNMVNLHSEKEINQILKMNFHTFQELGRDDRVLYSIQTRFNKAVKTLTKMGYIKNNSLTELGKFTTKIYSNELDISQAFMNLDIKLTEYTALTLVCAIAFEEKKDVKFFNRTNTKELKKLKHQLNSHKYLKHCEWIKKLSKLTSIVQPIIDQRKFTDILKNTSMPEGDLMRLLMQMLDRLEQIDRALINHEKQHIIRNTKYLIKDTLEGIGVY